MKITANSRNKEIFAQSCIKKRERNSIKNLSDDKELAETFNNYFNNAVKSLNLQCNPEHLNDVSDENNPIEIAIKKFKNQPSIVDINKNIPKTTTFNFDEIGSDSQLIP